MLLTLATVLGRTAYGYVRGPAVSERRALPPRSTDRYQNHAALQSGTPAYVTHMGGSSTLQSLSGDGSCVVVFAGQPLAYFTAPKVRPRTSCF
jgi:hypothetical protein